MAEPVLVIRLCASADAPQIVPLLQAQVAATGSTAPDPDALEDLVRALLATQFSDFLLAEVGERALGVLQINYRLSAWEAAPYAAIEDFYLAPELRARGAGVRMLDYACARAEARGAHFVQALAHPDDRALRRLYEELGFSATPQTRWRRDLGSDCTTAEEDRG